MRGAWRGVLAMALVIVAVGAGAIGDAEVVAAEPAGRFVPVAPTRLLDTRDGTGGTVGPIAAGGTFTLRVTGGVVPAAATAVALNLTITQSQGPGFLTAWPAGNTQPQTSSVNVVRANDTVANFAIVPVGAGGAISLFMFSGGHVIADVSGYWEQSGPTSAGRYVAVNPRRVVDTRETGRLAAGGQLDVGFTAVPAGSIAVAVNITSAFADAPGFVTAWPTGLGQPTTSNVNVAGGDVVPNTALVPLGPDGRISLFTSAATDLIVDLQGYVTGAAAPESSEGLFVPVVPFRVADSRSASGVDRLGAMFDQALQVAGAGAVPSNGVSAVAANLTVTDPWAPGFLSVYPGRTARPLVSNLNYQESGTVAGFALPRLGAGGTLNLVSRAQTEVIVDVSGYFTGETAPATAPAPVECADLMGYLYHAAGLANAGDTVELWMRDLADQRTDWLLDPAVTFYKIAPGCQYAIVAKPSPTVPDALAIYRIDTLAEASTPILISDGWGWAGAAFTPDARWIYLYAGSSGDIGSVVAVNARTGEERLAAQALDLNLVGGVTAQANVVVTRYERPPHDNFRMVACYFGAYGFGRFGGGGVPCNDNVVQTTGFSSGEYSDAGGTIASPPYAVLVSPSGQAVFRRGGSVVELVPTGAYRGRLSWRNEPVLSIDGVGVVLYPAVPGSYSDVGSPITLLDGVTADVPEFSKPLRPSREPPILREECAFLSPGC